MSLKARLEALIRARGPMSVAAYMELCLHDPEFGYYATRPRLGAEGDFITAPHVSQMVGELLGLWACEVFRDLGAPAAVRLVEAGPGDGTMMTDVLRAAGAAAPDFLRACQIVLLERSGPLKAAQRRALRRAGGDVAWIERIEDLRLDAPVIVLANEFLDCLPVSQAVLTPAGWRERRVGLDEAGALAFTLSSEAPHAVLPGRAPIGAIAEWSPDLEAFGTALGGMIVEAGGAALLIDYGAIEPAPGDTVQAVRGHRKEHPLASPGEADLTAHVRFDAFLAAARAAGAAAPPPVSQAVFLRRLGIETRAAALALGGGDRAGRTGRQLHRLIAPEEMGELFKVACVHSPGLGPPGFGGP